MKSEFPWFSRKCWS